MKQFYTCGEMLLALREEYGEYKYLLEELKKYVDIDEKSKEYYFTGMLADDNRPKGLDDKRIRLFVEKKYNDILKKIQSLKYNNYSSYLYRAWFDVEKNEEGLCELKYDDMFTPVDSKKYKPYAQIVDQEKFSEIIDELLSCDLMKVKSGCFKNNHDSICLEFDQGFISTSLGDESFIWWNGNDDTFNYSITKHNSPMLIEDILFLEIPSYKISPDWLSLLEKHEKTYDRELLFDVDIDARSKKGNLKLSELQKRENNMVARLMKEKKGLRK